VAGNARDDRIRLVDGEARCARHDRNDETAHRRIGKQLRRGAAEDGGVANALGGHVDRIFDRRERRQDSFDALRARRRERGQIKPDRLREIERVALESAGVGHHRRAFGWRFGEARENLRRVDQLLKRLHQDDGLARDERRHHRMVADHGAGMAACGGLGARAAAGMHEHDGLFSRSRPRGEREKQFGMAHLFHEQNDHLRCVVIDQEGQEVLGRELRLIAGGDDAGEAQLLCQQRKPQRRAHRAALRDDADPLPTLPGMRGRVGRGQCRQRQRLESQCDFFGKVDEADAIRTAQRQRAVACDFRHRLLLNASRLVHLGEARGEDERGA
jgi:hypothetical protein